ncbi:hypothetical protein [Clostridium sp. L74]|uniref:hypothetical protein n=1 Tax=Clostridium sp. L74 TaxID=1560217 RepID=UPI0006ABAB99|nr:hypothetical protein [Clostridium sp. L74]KOR24212.1 hypothetical protein ND00_29180 [Clostridium sp. L74]
MFMKFIKYKNVLKKLKKLGILKALVVILIAVLTIFWYYKIISFTQVVRCTIKIMRIYKNI